MQLYDENMAKAACPWLRCSLSLATLRHAAPLFGIRNSSTLPPYARVRVRVRCRQMPSDAARCCLGRRQCFTCGAMAGGGAQATPVGTNDHTSRQVAASLESLSHLPHALINACSCPCLRDLRKQGARACNIRIECHLGAGCAGAGHNGNFTPRPHVFARSRYLTPVG